MGDDGTEEYYCWECQSKVEPTETEDGELECPDCDGSFVEVVLFQLAFIQMLLSCTPHALLPLQLVDETEPPVLPLAEPRNDTSSGPQHPIRAMLGLASHLLAVTRALSAAVL